MNISGLMIYSLLMDHRKEKTLMAIIMIVLTGGEGVAQTNSGRIS